MVNDVTGDNLTRDSISTEADDYTTPEIEVTRAEIETTRADIADTLDAIKDKLKPEMLMDQAKDRVQEAAANLAEQAKTTVHSVVSDVTGHAKVAAKEAVTGAVSGAVDQAKGAVDNVMHTAQDAMGGMVDTAKDAGATLTDTVRRYPLPAALLALGAAWLFMKHRDDTRAAQSASRFQGDYSTGYSPSYSEYPDGESSSTGMVDGVKEKAQKAASALGDAAHAAQEKAADAMNATKEAMGNAASTAQDAGMGLVNTIQRNPIPVTVMALGATWLYLKNQDENKALRSQRSDENTLYDIPYDGYSEERVSRGIKEQIMEKTGQMGDAVGNALHTAKDKASEMTHQAKEYVSHFGCQATEQARMAGTSLQHSLETNPLPMGAVALGVGAAIALLVPETERENQYLGATRDRLMNKAQEKVHDITGKVQSVVEESVEAAKNMAQQEAKVQGLASP